MRLLGLDPGLNRTGWGVIEVEGSRLTHVAHGVVSTRRQDSLPVRLREIYDGLSAVLAEWLPAETAVEETFVNKNAVSTLKLGHARGVALLAPAHAGVPVAEYLPNLVKKTVVGAGHADKRQVEMMVRTLLPRAGEVSADAADALAVAICHAHHMQSARRIRAAATS